MEAFLGFIILLVVIYLFSKIGKNKRQSSAPVVTTKPQPSNALPNSDFSQFLTLPTPYQGNYFTLGGAYQRREALCSDNNCSCPKLTIPRNKGYIYVERYPNGNFTANVTCEEGARLRHLDLKIAHADAKHWWLTGKVPCRETPEN